MVDYYIDSVDGIDTNTGTSIDSPWKTFNNIPTAAGTFVGGENVYLKRGSHFHVDGVVNLPLWIVGGDSSSVTNHARITCYGTGALPIIDGDGTADLFLVYCENVAFWCECVEIRNVTLSAVTAPGINFVATGAANVGKEYSYIIRNNVVHDIAWDGMSIGDGADGTTTTANRREIAWNTVYNCRNDGIALQGDLSGVAIHHNVSHDIGSGDVTPIDTVTYRSGDGITAHANAQGLHIYANRVYRCIDGINVVNDGSGARNVIARNWVYECEEHCIWVTTDTTSVTKWDIWQNVLGLKSGMNATGSASKATGAGITVGWVTNDFGATATNQVHDVRIWHNTFYNATADIPCIILRARGASGGDSIWNVQGNVMDTTSTGRYQNWHRNGTTPTITVDRQVYDTNRANGWVFDGVAYATNALWSAALLLASVTLGDANSVVGDPSLVGNLTTAVDNGRLQAGSNALDLASNNFATVPYDYTGRLRPSSGAWDAGAFEKFSTPVACVGASSSGMDGVPLW